MRRDAGGQTRFVGGYVYMAYPVPAEPPATAGRVSARMAFSNFGAPVSVTAPPASEVFTPASIQFDVSPGPQ